MTTAHENLTAAVAKLAVAIKEAGFMFLTVKEDNSMSEADIAYTAGHMSALLAIAARLMTAVSGLKQRGKDSDAAKTAWFTRPDRN